MSNYHDSVWGKRFSYAPMGELAAFLSSYSMASQTLAIDGVNAENIQSTGTGMAMVNNVFIESLPADAELVIDDDPVGDAAGTSITTGYDQYFAIMAAADGTLNLNKAGVQALVGTAVLKIPNWDASLYACVGIMLVVNDSGSPLVIGTNDLTGDATFYDFTGPVFPHNDNLDRN